MLRNENKIARMSYELQEYAEKRNKDNEYLLSKLSELHAFIRSNYKSTDDRTYIMKKYVLPVSSLVMAA